MTYVPAHDFVLMYKQETGTITESADGDTPAALPALPTSPALVGFVDPADIVADDGNKKGFASGSPYALYDAKGARVYSLAADVRLASMAFVQKCMRGSGGPYGLAEMALYYGTSNHSSNGVTTVQRFAVCDQLGIVLSQGGAQEIIASAAFQAIAEQPGIAVTPTLSELRAVGPNLFWHNVLTCMINGINYRNSITGASFTLNHGLTRDPVVRPDWGDDEPLSRTSYTLMPHHNVVTGEITFSKKLPASLFTAAINSTDWGTLTFRVSDTHAIATGTAKDYTLTLTNVRPVIRRQSRVETSTQLMHSVSIIADDMLLAATA